MNEKIKKLTKKQKYNILLSHLAEIDFSGEEMTAEDAEAFIKHEVELLEKKNVSSTGEKKMTKEQVARAEVANEVLSFLIEDGGKYTCAELIKLIPSMAEFSNQKAYGVIKTLLADNKVERVEDKRKAYFKAV
jgi:hypothetical protein